MSTGTVEVKGAGSGAVPASPVHSGKYRAMSHESQSRATMSVIHVSSTQCELRSFAFTSNRAKKTIVLSGPSSQHRAVTYFMLSPRWSYYRECGSVRQ